MVTGELVWEEVGGVGRLEPNRVAADGSSGGKLVAEGEAVERWESVSVVGGYLRVSEVDVLPKFEVARGASPRRLLAGEKA